MKVLLAHKYFHLNGGADVFFLEVGRILEENGHEVAYFSTKDDKNLESNFSKYFVNPPNFNDGNLIQKLNEFIKIPYNFEAKKSFERLIVDFKPDIIHVFNIITQISPSILTAAKKRQIPIVMSCNDYKHICPNYKLYHHGKICEDCKGGKYFKCAINMCSHDSLPFSVASSIESYIHHFLNIYIKNIDLFLFASDFMAHKTEEFWNKKIKWSKLLNPFNIPKKLSSTTGKYGLYFGRLIEEKGVKILLESLINNLDITFKIVGSGPQHNELIEFCTKNGLTNVEFLGEIWGEPLDHIISVAKFVVVPSIWHENFPYVILQAFSQSKPVIGSNRGGIPEMILHNERGLVYNADDPKELSENIKYLYENNRLCDIMGIKARQYIENTFNDSDFYNSLISNYNLVLK